MLQTCLAVAAGWFAGGFMGGTVGFGGVMAALPFVFLVLPPEQAVLVCCLVSGVSTSQLAWLYHKKAVLHDLLWIGAGCLPGSMLGVIVLQAVSVRSLQLMIASMLICFILLQLLRSRSTWRLPDSRTSLFLAGMSTGFVGASISMMGVPLGIFILLKKWDKDRSRGTMAITFCVTAWCTIASQGLSGLYTKDMLFLALSGAVASIIGQRIGYRVGKYINQKLFTQLVLTFLTFVALILFYKALAG